MFGIYVWEMWFISLSYVSWGIIIWFIMINLLRLVIFVWLSFFWWIKIYLLVEGRILFQSFKNCLNDVEVIVNVICNDGFFYMYIIVFRRYGKVLGSLLMSGLIMNQYVKLVMVGNYLIFILLKVFQLIVVCFYI